MPRQASQSTGARLEGGVTLSAPVGISRFSAREFSVTGNRFWTPETWCLR